MAMNIPCVAVRGSTGISLSYGPPNYEDVNAFIKDDSKSCKAMAFSPDGSYFAWLSTPFIKIALCNTWKVIATIEKPKVCAIQFSPLGTYLMTWEPFIVSPTNPQGSPQLHLWKSENGKHIKSFIQKRQIDWEPQWSKDEKLCGLLINDHIAFYENSDFDNVVQRINWTRVTKYKISPGIAPYHIVCYMPGKAGQPSIAHLFQYPNINFVQSVVRKSFFQADRVHIYWNKIGTSVLIMTTMDVDKSSYYGKQTLHYMNIKGDTAMVTLGEEGPICAVEWSPKGNEFCVIYGLMPSKATLYNLKCEPIFEFGKKHRNSIYYNPHGNIILLGGFGNLRGDIELWDITKKKLIASCKAPDSTLLDWSPDGEHFMTATTAPRLRMSNGFKIWHYTGTLLYERPWNKQAELWEVLWQTFLPSIFTEKKIIYEAVAGIEPSQPQASKEAYRPPSARAHKINFKLHDNPDPIPLIKKPPSKSALKNKRKREAKKAKKELEINQEIVADSPNSKSNGQELNSVLNMQIASVTYDSQSTMNFEKDKKIELVQGKLKKISKDRELVTSGPALPTNTMFKSNQEEAHLEELRKLQL